MSTTCHPEFGCDCEGLPPLSVILPALDSCDANELNYLAGIINSRRSQGANLTPDCECGYCGETH